MLVHCILNACLQKKTTKKTVHCWTDIWKLCYWRQKIVLLPPDISFISVRCFCTVSFIVFKYKIFFVNYVWSVLLFFVLKIIFLCYLCILLETINKCIKQIRLFFFVSMDKNKSSEEHLHQLPKHLKVTHRQMSGQMT